MNTLLGRAPTANPSPTDYGSILNDCELGLANGESIPPALRDSRVVICGGGPCGLLTAIVLSHLHFRDVTVLERLEDDPVGVLSRTYVFAMNGRGQKSVNVIPGLLDHMKTYTPTVNGYLSCRVGVGGSGDIKCVDPRAVFKDFKPGMLYTRPTFVRGLRAFLDESHTDTSAIKIVNSATVTGVSFDRDAQCAVVHYDNNAADPDSGEDKHATIQADFVVGCDGANSATARAVRAAYDDRAVRAACALTTSHGLATRELPTYTDGKRIGSVVVGEDILAHLYPEVPDTFAHTHWTQINGRDFNMSILPSLQEDIDMRGGLLASIAMARDSALWGLTDVDDAFAVFAQNFPQLDIRRHITPDAMLAFINGRYSNYPLSSMVNSLGVSALPQPTAQTARSSVGVVLLGDAAHPTPPVLGQGLNCALEDVAFLARTIVQVSKSDGSDGARDWGKVALLFDTVRRPDIKAVVELSSFAGSKPKNDNKLNL